jgi:hypothetical protein
MQFNFTSYGCVCVCLLVSTRGRARVCVAKGGQSLLTSAMTFEMRCVHPRMTNYDQ